MGYSKKEMKRLKNIMISQIFKTLKDREYHNIPLSEIMKEEEGFRKEINFYFRYKLKKRRYQKYFKCFEKQFKEYCRIFLRKYDAIEKNRKLNETLKSLPERFGISQDVLDFYGV